MLKKWIERLSWRQRWAIHLLVISAPIFAGLFNARMIMHFPAGLAQLPRFLITHLVLWTACLALGFLISEIGRADLRLFRISWPKAIGMGLLWSVILRLSLIPVMIVLQQGLGHDAVAAYGQRMMEIMNLGSLVGHPFQAVAIYGATAAVAGIFEELWRDGFLAGLRRIFPHAFTSRLGTAAMIVLTAAVFGLAHLYQGALGVGITFAVGIGLGTILVRRHSYWETACAHIAFDATTFALAYHLAAKGAVSGM